MASSKGISAAILFVEEEFTTTDKGRIMGRHSANAGFINAWARHAACDEYYAYVRRRQDLLAFQETINNTRASAGLPTVSTTAIHYDQPADLSRAGLLYLPDPNLALHAFYRRASADSARVYSLCGITHTLSSHAAMELVAKLLTAPLQPWDALICTSKSARKAVEYLLSSYSHYLAEQFSMAPPRTALKLPVIPLGVDCSRFAGEEESRSLRGKWRSQLGIGENDAVVLYFGRLSFHAKANPMPVYRSLQIVRERTGHNIHLLMVGQAANRAILQALEDGAAHICPDIKVHFLDGGDAAIAKEIWYAADVFTSLSDNIQETFGLAPIEAMAAGLPCVVSDWDGYRDTVVDGVTGFLVPTYAPGANAIGSLLATRYGLGLDTYDRYIGNASQCVAVDIGAAASGFEDLLTDPALRRDMSRQARQRAATVYDWKHVIASYQELWQELAHIRHGERPFLSSTPDDAHLTGALQHPFQPDPFVLFGGHATRTYDELEFGPGEQGGNRKVQNYLDIKMLNYGLPLCTDVIQAILNALSGPPLDAKTLLAKSNRTTSNRTDPNQFWLCLAWLLKMNILRVVQRSIRAQSTTVEKHPRS